MLSCVRDMLSECAPHAVLRVRHLILCAPYVILWVQHELLWVLACVAVVLRTQNDMVPPQPRSSQFTCACNQIHRCTVALDKDVEHFRVALPCRLFADRRSSQGAIEDDPSMTGHRQQQTATDSNRQQQAATDRVRLMLMPITSQDQF